MIPLSKTDPEWLVLDGSLAFQMSLGAKELFHSNVMEWALDEFPNLCSQLFGIPNPTIKVAGAVNKTLMRVSRERQNVDLVVEIVQHVGSAYSLELIFVENKLKAIPDQAQLDEYAEKASNWKTKYWPKIPDFDDEARRGGGHKSLKPRNVLLFLMAPVRPSFFSTPNANSVVSTYCSGHKLNGSPLLWTYLPYRKWAGDLNLQIPRPPPPAVGYQSLFVGDYVKHLNCGVLPLIERIRDGVSNHSSTTTLKQVLLATASNAVATELRIHDVLAKSAYDEIRQLVLRQLRWDRLKSYVDMSKGMPQFAFQFILWTGGKAPNGAKPHKIQIGVQIQGDQYRRFIDKDFDESWIANATRNPLPLYQWAIDEWMLASDSAGLFPFALPQIDVMKGGKSVSISGGLPLGHEPFKFSVNRFRYSRIKIPDSCTVDCVVTELIRDLVMLAGKLYKSNGWPTIQACSCGPSDSEPRIEAGIVASPRSEPVRGIPAEGSERVRAAEHSWPADAEESEPFSLAKKAVENWGKSKPPKPS